VSPEAPATLQKNQSSKTARPVFFRKIEILMLPLFSIVRIARLGISVGFLLLTSIPAWSHAVNESFLTLQVDGTNLQGRLDISRIELQRGIGLLKGGVQHLNQDELLRREEALALDIVNGLEVKVDGRLLHIGITDFTTLPLNSGEYARLLFEVSGSTDPVSAIELNCTGMFIIDKLMHGLIRVEHENGTAVAAYTADSPTHRFALRDSGGSWSRWMTFVVEGVWHIWIGFDHVLFLLALLLPSVLQRERDGWAGVHRFRPALINVVKIVSSFTVAHSITLSLAALAIVELPSQLVESAIAGSVILAASNNLYPWFKSRAWIVAFAFGLIHGFGFANVLGDLGLAHKELAAALIGFNVGVELGQLAIVAVFLPVAFAMRRQWVYRRLTLTFGSVGVMAVASVWIVERMFDIQVLPF
jgi:hypothetical protein